MIDLISYLESHIIIIGFGRVGARIAVLLNAVGP